MWKDIADIVESMSAQFPSIFDSWIIKFVD